MSSSVLRALAWSYFRQVRLSFVLAVSLLIVAPLGFTSLFASAGIPFDAETIAPKALRWFHFSYLGTAFLLFAFVSAIPHIESLKRMYALPITTRTLVVWMMGSTAVMAVLGNVVCLAVFRGTFQAEWPVLGTSLAIAVGVCVLGAMAAKLTHFRIRTAALVLAAASTFAVWVVSRYFPAGLRAPMQLWFDVMPGDWIVLTCCSGVSFLVCVRGLQRDRRGDANRVEMLVDWRAGESRIAEVPRSPRHAIEQFHRFGMLPAAICFPILFCVTFFICYRWSVRPPRNPMDGISGLLIVFSGGVGMILGVVDLTSQAVWKMGQSISTMPINNGRLAAAKLRVLGKSTLFAWIMLVTSMSLAYAAAVAVFGLDWFPMTANAMQGAKFGGNIPVLFATSLLTCWTTGGLVSSIVWTGRQAFVVSVVYIGIISTVIVIAILRLYLPPEPARVASQAVMWSLAGLAITLAVHLFATTLRRSLINFQAVGLGLAIWAAASATCWGFAGSDPRVLCQLGLLSIISALPIAAAPLAVEWNRHR